MSNRICGRCKSSVVVPWNNVKDFYKCMNCSAMGYAEKFPEKTVFHSITQSPEVLVEKLVYSTNVRRKKPLYNWKRQQIADKWFLCTVWKSSVTDETYSTKAEALAATVEKLKEVTE